MGLRFARLYAIVSRDKCRGDRTTLAVNIIDWFIIGNAGKQRAVSASAMRHYNPLIKICYSINNRPTCRGFSYFYHRHFIRNGSWNDTAPDQSQSSADRGSNRLSLIYRWRSIATRADRNELHSSPRASSRALITPTGPATGINAKRNAHINAGISGIPRSLLAPPSSL